MKIYYVDAFTETLFSGNPAAVCYCSQWPNDTLMQNIAAENNLPETAFIVKEKENYHIRWFTPGYEIDLCGHATLAGAFVIHHFIEPEAQKITFLSQSGILTVLCQDDTYTLDFPARMPAAIAPIPELSAALGTSIEELYLSRDLVAVVKDESVVRNLKPDFLRLRSIDSGDGVIVTAPGEDCDFVSRCFYPKSGVNEDPVTGSAHCNLIPYWQKRLQKDDMVAKQLSQRGGTLYCGMQKDRVTIRGNAVLYATGELNL